MSNRTLYAIESDLESIHDLLGETDGEITPEIEQTIDQWFAEIGAERDRKIDGYCALISTLEALASARRAEAERLRQHAKTDENRATWLRRRLQDFMSQHGLRKFETTRFKLGIQKNGGVLPLVMVENLQPDQVEARFQRVEISINKETIREALDRGEQLPFARLGERGESLRIR